MENKVISVWLQSRTETFMKRLWRCVKCGLPVVEYYTDTKMMVEGETPIDEISEEQYPLLVQCKRCHTKYLFR